MGPLSYMQINIDYIQCMILFVYKKMIKIGRDFLKKDYLFIFRERDKEGETSLCGCLLQAPYWGPGRQPSHVPQLGIEPVTLWFTGWHSSH